MCPISGSNIQNIYIENRQFFYFNLLHQFWLLLKFRSGFDFNINEIVLHILNLKGKGTLIRVFL